MGRASTYTLLALDRYAKIMGLAPPHFNTVAGTDVFNLENGGCNDLWWQYAWQANDRVSREDLAIAIQSAEEDIARTVGYWPAPVWISEEPHRYPLPHRREYYGTGFDLRGQFKAIKADYGYILAGGQRAVTLIGTATDAGGTLVYSDPDGDGIDELATVTLPTTQTNACECKLYFTGHSGAQEWEIRPLKSAAIAGGVLTITVDTWMLVDPDLWEAYPTTAGSSAIAFETSGNFVTSVDVYREYNDTTAQMSEFYWESKPDTSILGCCSCGESTCLACTHTTADGCLHVRDVKLGLVVPQAATYDETDLQWEPACWSACREPDLVKVWYYAGDLSKEYLAGRNCDLLSDWWAQIIAWIATARLERDACTCGPVKAHFEYLREDLTFTGQTGAHLINTEEIDNPFGTRRGEIFAWRKVRKLANNIPSVAAI